MAEPRGRPCTQSGTFFAAPFVRAAAALLARSGASNVDVADALLRAATHMGEPDRDPITGWGLIKRPADCTA